MNLPPLHHGYKPEPGYDGPRPPVPPKGPGGGSPTTPLTPGSSAP